MPLHREGRTDKRFIINIDPVECVDIKLGRSVDLGRPEQQVLQFI